MKIIKVKVKKFWNKQDIIWELNPNVNILSGINGSGKSTLLDIIAHLCFVGKFPSSLREKFESVEIEFENNYVLKYFNVKDSFERLKNRAKKEFELSEIIDNVKKDFKGNLSKINQIKIEAGITYASKNGKKCKVEEILDILKFDVVSTFDQSLKKDEEAIKISELKNNEISTELDWEIYGLQEEYLNYQVNISKKIETFIQQKEDNIDTKISNLYSKKKTFFDIVNGLFSQTNKSIDEDNNRISFVYNDGTKISPYELSSGEKQLLIIYLKALNQNDKEFLFFLDEPEISLHIDWQKVLLKNIKLLNPNCQIIMACHSPAIIMDGWLNNVIDISDITLK